jgi:uncharacterized protein (DUF1697 family)
MTTNFRVAFLRGINVGGHRVKMDELRRLFEQMGFANVSTFIASGNVIFEAPAKKLDEARIESVLREALGFEAPVFVRTREELAAIVAHRPFAKKDLDNPDFRLHVCFLRGALSEEQQSALTTFETAMDAFHVQGREIYWLCRGPLNQSLAKWPQIEKKVTGPATARNITMLRRLTGKWNPIVRQGPDSA